MKILQVNCVYPYGSTGKITDEIHKELMNNNHFSSVAYSRGKKTSRDELLRICGSLGSKVNHAVSRFTGLAYGGCFLQTNKLLSFIKKDKPDIVHLQCINGYFVNIYKLVGFLKEHKIPTVITLHAEFMYTANCPLTLDCEKWKTGCGDCPRLFQAVESYFFDRTSCSFQLMKRAFEDFGDRLTVVGVSNWLSERAKMSPIMENANIITITNGINTGIFYPRNNPSVKNELKILPNEKIVLWVTSGFTEEKGRSHFMDLADSINDRSYRFIVAGTGKPDDYNGKIEFLGRISDQNKLAELYSSADVSVSCSKQESYPTVALESQCCGTPFVGFDVGGVSETIFDGMGQIVEYGNIQKLKEAVECWCENKNRISKEIVSACMEEFSSSAMTRKYIDLYKSIMENNYV